MLARLVARPRTDQGAATIRYTERVRAYYNQPLSCRESNALPGIYYPSVRRIVPRIRINTSKQSPNLCTGAAKPKGLAFEPHPLPLRPSGPRGTSFRHIKHLGDENKPHPLAPRLSFSRTKVAMSKARSVATCLSVSGTRYALPGTVPGRRGRRQNLGARETHVVVVWNEAPVSPVASKARTMLCFAELVMKKGRVLFCLEPWSRKRRQAKARPALPLSRRLAERGRGRTQHLHSTVPNTANAGHITRVLLLPVNVNRASLARRWDGGISAFDVMSVFPPVERMGFGGGSRRL